MHIEPDQKTILANIEAGNPGILWTELLADLETPVSAFLKLTRGKPNSFLLESVEGGAFRGRYSFIGFAPDIIWRCKNGNAEINRNAELGHDTFVTCPVSKEKGVLGSLKALEIESRINLPSHMPPMSAGLIGYLSYDMVRLTEEIPNSNPDTIGVPESIFVRPTIMAVFDLLKDTVTIITPVRAVHNIGHLESYDAAKKRLEGAVTLLAQPPELFRTSNNLELNRTAEPTSNLTRLEFQKIVKKCIEYINSGDVFQVVPSQRLKIPFNLSSTCFYRALRRLNPSPFLFLLDFDGFSVAGSSPEILVRVRDGKITLRPLAGTRKRGKTEEEDKALAKELLNDEKERAEHLMLLDLGRNDVGRVAKIGTVRPTEQFVIEYYSHVMHIASNVEGELDDNFDAIDAVLAGFPAGTVSGAPKVRAMEIIDEIEPERRGIYGGCIGYFGANGDVDTCIALRTGIIKDGSLYVQAGAGVVADSDPESEYQETLNKARALFRAASESFRYL
ncbi:MAG: Anthranilate synthase component 1 [Alphaproteobacteria bacterium MarineAlpha3_Bin5]|nr:anthranilate synthase component I [Magnetovibrio sp.]PPR75930.1 MAG: Anthranilate synthase component 1 [Alphaproteobacteria bacterium MarineAlpha3_Bin5]